MNSPITTLSDLRNERLLTPSPMQSVASSDTESVFTGVAMPMVVDVSDREPRSLQEAEMYMDRHDPEQQRVMAETLRRKWQYPLPYVPTPMPALIAKGQAPGTEGPYTYNPLLAPQGELNPVRVVGPSTVGAVQDDGTLITLPLPFNMPPRSREDVDLILGSSGDFESTPNMRAGMCPDGMIKHPKYIDANGNAICAPPCEKWTRVGKIPRHGPNGKKHLWGKNCKTAPPKFQSRDGESVWAGPGGAGGCEESKVTVGKPKPKDVYRNRLGQCPSQDAAWKRTMAEYTLAEDEARAVHDSQVEIGRWGARMGEHLDWLDLIKTALRPQRYSKEEMQLGQRNYTAEMGTWDDRTFRKPITDKALAFLQRMHPRGKGPMDVNVGDPRTFTLPRQKMPTYGKAQVGSKYRFGPLSQRYNPYYHMGYQRLGYNSDYNRRFGLTTYDREPRVVGDELHPRQRYKLQNKKV